MQAMYNGATGLWKSNLHGELTAFSCISLAVGTLPSHKEKNPAFGHLTFTARIHCTAVSHRKVTQGKSYHIWEYNTASLFSSCTFRIEWMRNEKNIVYSCLLSFFYCLFSQEVTIEPCVSDIQLNSIKLMSIIVSGNTYLGK